MIADDFVSLDADQGSDVAHFEHLLGEFRRNEMTVREDLKVAVAMFSQDIQQSRVHERFSADDSKERVPHLLGLVDHAMHAIRRDLLLCGSHIDPAPLATEVAAVRDRNVDKRRIEFALLQSAFVTPDRSNAFEPRVPGQLAQQTFIGFEQQSLGHSQIHK